MIVVFTLLLLLRPVNTAWRILKEGIYISHVPPVRLTIASSLLNSATSVSLSRHATFNSRLV